MDLFNQIRKKLVIFIHFKGFNISQKPKSSPLSYFAQKTSLNLAPIWYPIIFTCQFRSDSCSYISTIDISGPGVKQSSSPTPGASNFHFWASWNNQLYARRASKNIYRSLSDIDKLVNIRVSTYIHICYMLFNQQQCFIYSTASFLWKSRAKKVEKLCILVIKQFQQMTA